MQTKLKNIFNGKNLEKDSDPLIVLNGFGYFKADAVYMMIQVVIILWIQKRLIKLP